MSRPSPRTWVLLGVVGIAACGDPLGSAGDEPTSEVSSTIINGTTVSVDMRGTPRLVTNGAGCSSTLLSDRWLLTARHCVTVDNTIGGALVSDPSSINATLQSGASAKGDRLYAYSGRDVALVHLDKSLLAPSGRPFANPLHLTTAAGLQGGVVYCQGWGDNTLNNGGWGTLRYAVLPVGSSDSSGFTVVVNSSGQIPWYGDSGSACFLTVDGVERVVGVASRSDGQTQASYVGVDVFRDWAEGLMGNAATLFADPNYTGAAQSLLPSGSGGGYYDYGRLISGVGNDTVTGLTVPPFWSLSLYEGVGFTNYMQTFGGNAPDMTNNLTCGPCSGYNDRTSSAFVSGGVTLYRDEDQYQRLLTLTHAGRYNGLAAADNLITSLIVPMGWRVQLFDQNLFSGPSAVFHEGTYRTIDSNISGRVSSIIVEEPVEVFTNPNYSGRVSRLLPGCYDWNQTGLPAESIRSIYLPGGMAAVVYDDVHYSGTLTTFTTSQPTLPANLDGTVTSLCIRRF